MKRIAIILILALAVAASGCVGGQEKKPNESTSLGSFENVEKYEFENGSVTCYAYVAGYAGGLSCMPTSEIEGGLE